MKWAIQLSENDIMFESQTVIKGQAVEYFIAKHTLPESSTSSALVQLIMYVDGSSNDKRCKVGVLLIAV